MGVLAFGMFVMLIVYVDEIFVTMSTSNLHLALFSAFLFGIICSYSIKSRKKRR